MLLMPATRPSWPSWMALWPKICRNLAFQVEMMSAFVPTLLSVRAIMSTESVKVADNCRREILMYWQYRHWPTTDRFTWYAGASNLATALDDATVHVLPILPMRLL